MREATAGRGGGGISVRRGGAAIAALIAAAALAGCSEDVRPLKPRFDPPTVTISVAPEFVGPRDIASVFLSLTPVTGDPVTGAWLVLDAGGHDRDSVNLPITTANGEQSGSIALTVNNAPISKHFTLIGRAISKSGRVAQDTTYLTIGDTTPPTLRWVCSGATVQVGQQAAICAAYDDHSGIARQELHLSGAVTRHEIFDRADVPTTASIAFEVMVPDLPGDSIVQRAVGLDMYGLRTEIRQVYRIVP